MRRGDACTTPGRPCKPIERLLVPARAMASLYGLKTLFVATDDSAVLEHLKQRAARGHEPWERVVYQQVPPGFRTRRAPLHPQSAFAPAPSHPAASPVPPAATSASAPCPACLQGMNRTAYHSSKGAPWVEHRVHLLGPTLPSGLRTSRPILKRGSESNPRGAQTRLSTMSSSRDDLGMTSG